MPLSDLSSVQLRQLVELIKEKESLQRQLAKVDAELAKLDGAVWQAPKRGRKRVAGTRMKRGATLQEKALDVLGKAGASGLSVKDLAAQAGVKSGSLSVWIYTSGKKVAGLKKIAPAKYVYIKR